MGFLRSVLLGLILAGSATSATAQSSVCKNLNHCVDILERHAPDEFDYAVLAEEFSRFGLKANDRLVRMLGSEDKVDQSNAIAIIAQKPTGFTPAQLDQILRSWPIGRNQSALMRVGQSAPPDQRVAIAKKIMMSGDSVLTHTAFDALRELEERLAVQTLEQTIFALQDGQRDQAIALSKVIISIAETDPSDRFQRLALGLASDPNISPMANLAGISASQSVAPKALIELLQNPVAERAMKQYLTSYADAANTGLAGMEDMIRSNPEMWLPEFEALFRTNAELIPTSLLHAVSLLPRPMAEPTIDRFLASERDFFDRGAAILAGMRVNPGKYRMQAQMMAERDPVESVRHVAKQGLSNSDINWKLTFSLFGALDYQRSLVSNCPIDWGRFDARLDQVPFYDLPEGPRRLWANRQNMTSAWPLIGRWIIGFNSGEIGGGLATYDFETNGLDFILKTNVQAIVPFLKRGNELYPNQYWIVTGPDYFFSSGSVHKLDVNESSLDLSYSSRLPSIPIGIAANADQSLTIGFTDHPALKMSADGQLTRACP